MERDHSSPIIKALDNNIVHNTRNSINNQENQENNNTSIPEYEMYIIKTPTKKKIKRLNSSAKNKRNS